MTPEREKAIRMAVKEFSKIYSGEANDLLIEIDRLREKLSIAERCMAMYFEMGLDDEGQTGRQALERMRED